MLLLLLLLLQQYYYFYCYCYCYCYYNHLYNFYRFLNFLYLITFNNSSSLSQQLKHISPRDMTYQFG